MVSNSELFSVLIFLFTSLETTQIQIRQRILWFKFATTCPRTVILGVIYSYFIFIRHKINFHCIFWVQMNVWHFANCFVFVENTLISLKLLIQCVKKFRWKLVLKKCPRISVMKVRRVESKVSTNQLAKARDVSIQNEFKDEGKFLTVVVRNEFLLKKKATEDFRSINFHHREDGEHCIEQPIDSGDSIKCQSILKAKNQQ